METANAAMHSHLPELSFVEALASLERMPNPPSVENLTSILRQCRKHKDPSYALRLHAYLRNCGLEAHKSLGNYLVPLLVEAGSLCNAQQVFDRLVYRNEHSWTSLIAGYVECGELCHAFELHQKMQDDCVRPSGHTVVALLKACARLKDTERGQEIHAEITRMGLLERDAFVGNTLVDMYSKCGLLAKAQEVFDKLPVRTVVSWNALIAGYADHDLGHEALKCLEQMQLTGLSPNEVTFISSLKACGSVGAIDKGQEIHADIAGKGLLETHPFVGNALVDMYAKCGWLAKAHKVFDKLPVRNAISWTALIAGYAEHDLGHEALNCFEQMQLEGVSPDAVTYICSLKACGSIGAIDKGQELHAEIAGKGWLKTHPSLGNTLVGMYAKCGLLAKSHEVFDNLPVRNAVSWTALIAGYAEHDLGQDALNCFEQMQLEGVSPNAVTFICSLKASGSTGAIVKGQEIHAEVAEKGLLETYPFIGSTLVGMYAKCGLFTKAHEVFDKLPVQDAVSWNALITGYAEHDLGHDALNCFEQMQLEGVPPDAVTFICSLKACGSLGAIGKGQEIHAEIARKGLLETNPIVGNSLVDMYAKCGLLAKAHEVFEKLPVRTAVSWSALIAGYAQLGESENVFLLVDRMRAEDLKPDEVTFLSVLTVCSHAGLVEKGQTYFEAMSKDYGITPTIEHHNCMVDLLGRAGHLDKAVEIIKKMPFNPDLTAWHTLLGACRKWGNVEIGRWAFKHAMELDKKDSPAYVLMSNIYADAHMQKDAKQVDLMRLKEQAWKKPGQTWTNIGGTVRSFLVGVTGHPQSNLISAKLEDLSFKIREQGYVPDLHWLSQDSSDNLKAEELCGHCEKLAIAYALINTPKGRPIHVVKNHRVCRDCHLTTAFISKVEQRTILVRDANRFHVFKNGKCSCGGESGLLPYLLPLDSY